jgi:hypothetical protein
MDVKDSPILLEHKYRTMKISDNLKGGTGMELATPSTAQTDKTKYAQY